METPLCLCGCGKEVNRNKTYGWSLYVKGHGRWHRDKPIRTNPPKCLCGCDELVNWNTDKHDWNKYLCGHNNKNRRKKERIRSGDYYWLYRPNHSFCNSGGYVKEQRVVMEEELGRYLYPEEVVHHKDLNPLNNHLDNLEVVASGAEHTRLHKTGIVLTDTHKQKISERLRGENHPLFGKTHSRETKVKISEAMQRRVGK